MRGRAVRRRGGAALVALVCLGTMGVVVVGLLRVSKARSDQLRRVEWRCQADWLVEAGLERAAARLGADRDYGGETWRIPGESLGGSRSAEVVITRLPAGDDGAEPVRVQVRADYPADGFVEDRARRSRTFAINPDALTRGSRE
ncbi:hypothetical protein AB1L88_18645 [Tautonia sp. JC769]|uniref:hypothetical protein n=1 Tax=Tautonia sp. JC769 TaxID=3232135 RepID=UPI00345775BA